MRDDSVSLAVANERCAVCSFFFFFLITASLTYCTVHPIKVCTLSFSMFTELCDHQHNFRTFLSTQKEKLYPLAVIPHSNSPSPRQPLTCFLSVNLPPLDNAYK